MKIHAMPRSLDRPKKATLPSTTQLDLLGLVGEVGSVRRIPRVTSPQSPLMLLDDWWVEGRHPGFGVFSHAPAGLTKVHASTLNSCVKRRWLRLHENNTEARLTPLGLRLLEALT